MTTILIITNKQTNKKIYNSMSKANREAFFKNLFSLFFFRCCRNRHLSFFLQKKNILFFSKKMFIFKIPIEWAISRILSIQEIWQCSCLYDKVFRLWLLIALQTLINKWVCNILLYLCISWSCISLEVDVVDQLNIINFIFI